MDILQRLKGQEHVKRALEVAAVGYHDMFVLAEDMTGIDVIEYLLPITKELGIDMHFANPCHCGAFGSAEFTCECSKEDIQSFQIDNRIMAQGKISVKFPRTSYEKLTSQRLSEPLETVKERIEKGRD